MVLIVQLLPQEYKFNTEESTVQKENTTDQVWEQVFNVIQKSFSINKHLNFFN